MSYQCQGKCKGDRPMDDGPAFRAQRPDGTPVMACSCCSLVLRRVSTTDFAKAIAKGRFRPGVTAKSATLWTDDLCGYDQVSISELIPA